MIKITTIPDFRQPGIAFIHYYLTINLTKVTYSIFSG